MEFQLIQGASRYNPSFGYDDDAYEEHFIDPSDVELDEIILIRKGERIEIGGRARIHDMKAAFKKYGIVFASYAANVLTSYAFFIKEVDPPESRHRKSVEGFDRHFKTLLAGKVSAPVRLEDLRKIKFYSGYFSVLKSSGEAVTARSIFNGKKFSRGCRPPPCTNLPDFLRVLEALTKLVRDNGRGFHSITADLRHAFHQIPLDNEETFFFAISRLIDGKESMWRWLSLPMGWSWSPLLCQSIGFGLLLIVLEDIGLDVSEYKKLDTPPSIVMLKDKDSILTLVMTLWYDNIGIFTCDGAIANKLAVAIPHLFETCFHYYLKDSIRHLGPRSLNKTAPEHTEYLGVSFRLSSRRDSEGKAISTLEWQPTLKKRNKWSTLVIPQHTNCRTTAKALGVIMWSNRLAYVPLCRLDRELNILRRASSASDESGGWDAPFVLTNDEVLLLQHDLASACADEWYSQPIDKSEDRERIFLATDSSKPKWAYVHWTSYRGLPAEAPHSGYWKDLGNQRKAINSLKR